MKAKFIGDQNNPKEVIPDEFEAFGVTFPKGKFVTVPEGLEAKFAGNSHFETTVKAKDAPKEDEGKEEATGGAPAKPE